MSSPSHFPALSDWRTVGMVVVCAAAGGGLRWGLREYEAGRGDGDGGVTVPGQVAPGAALLPPLTAVSWRALSDRDRFTALAANLPDMTVGEIAPLVEALSATVQEGEGGYGTPESTELLLRALFMRWAELDAHGMIAALEAPAFQFSPTTRQFAVNAWAELGGLTAVKAVAKQWPGIANTAAWEILRRQPEQMETLLPFLTESRMENPDGDRSLIDLLGIERYVVLAAAMEQQGYVWWSLGDLAREDAPRALRIAKSLPPGGIRDAALWKVLVDFSEPTEGSGLSFREEYEALPPGYARNQLAPDYAMLLAKENPGAALEWARTLPRGEVRTKALEAVVGARADESSLAESVRLRAAAWLIDQSNSQFAPGGEYEKWHKAEPKAAEAWLATVTDPALLAELVPDPALTPEPAGQARTDALAAIVKDGVKDEAWAAANREDRYFLAAEAVRARAGGFNPEEAVKFFDAMAPEERSLGAWYQASRVKAGLDVEQTSQWVQFLPPGAERDAATTALVDYLTGVPGPFGIPGMPHGFPWRLTEPVDEQDAKAAFTWAASMSGETERIRYMTQAARAWVVQDATAAQAAVAASKLPEAEKQSLLRQLQEGAAR